MDEITYRRKLGFVLSSFFLIDLIGIIIFTLIPYISGWANMSVELSTKMNVSVGVVFNFMTTIIFGYIVTHKELCPNLRARVAATVMLLLVVFNLVMKINVMIGGAYWFDQIYWYDTVVSLLCFLSITGYLFSLQIWLIVKLLGSFAYFLNIILDFIYYYLIRQYLDYGNFYFDTYSTIVIIFDVVWVIVYLVLVALTLAWTMRKTN